MLEVQIHSDINHGHTFVYVSDAVFFFLSGCKPLVEAFGKSSSDASSESLPLSTLSS